MASETKAPPDLLQRVRRFLDIAQRRGIRVVVSEDGKTVDLLDKKTGRKLLSRPVSDFDE